MRRSRKTTFISITLLVGVVIIGHYIGWTIPLENFLRSVVNGGSEIAYTQSLKFGQEEFNSVAELRNAYQELQKQLSSTDALKTQVTLLQDQNNKLQQELQFLQDKPYTYVGVNVIGKNVDPVANTILLNRGTESGITEGNPVIAFDGIYVGKIIRAEKNTSIVRLLQDGQSKVAATIINEDKSIGVIEGGFGVSVQMNLIPENEKVEVGNTIITSGLEDGIPRGLLIGTVDTVKKEAYEPFQQAIVSPRIQTNQLDTVIVITRDI